MGLRKFEIGAVVDKISSQLTEKNKKKMPSEAGLKKLALQTYPGMKDMLKINDKIKALKEHIAELDKVVVTFISDNKIKHHQYPHCTVYASDLESVILGNLTKDLNVTVDTRTIEQEVILNASNGDLNAIVDKIVKDYS